MKRLLLLFIFAFALCSPALASVCAEVVANDGAMCRECALGDMGADALREYTGADIALFASGDLGIGLQPGEITDASLAESFPNDADIVLLTVSPGELRALLEEGLAHIVLTDEVISEAASAYEGFFCVSGFSFSYDASAPAGGRVYELGLEGDATLAVSSRYAEGEPAGTVLEALAAYCDARERVTPPDTDRIEVLGAFENTIVGGLIPKGFVLVVALVAVVFGGARYRRRMNTER